MNDQQDKTVMQETVAPQTHILVVEDSIIKSLIANYHSRVKYPDQKTA